MASSPTTSTGEAAWNRVRAPPPAPTNPLTDLRFPVGPRPLIVGRLQQRTWTAEDGSARSTVEVVAEELGPSLRWATATPARLTKRGGAESQIRSLSRIGLCAASGGVRVCIARAWPLGPPWAWAIPAPPDRTLDSQQSPVRSRGKARAARALSGPPEVVSVLCIPSRLDGIHGEILTLWSFQVADGSAEESGDEVDRTSDDDHAEQIRQ